MHLISLLLITMILGSCADSINESFKTKSKITPLFTPKTFNEKIGNGEHVIKKIKIPLTQDTVGSYDYAEILDDESLNDQQASVIHELWQGLRHGLYNMGIKFGVSNRIRYTADYDGLPKIDSEYIKSIKITKVFFAIESCHPKDEKCIIRNEKNPSSLKFLDQFFVNLSIIKPEDKQVILDDPITFLTKKEFSTFANRAFSKVPFSFDALKNENGEIVDDAFYNVNVAHFKNLYAPKDYNQNVRDEGKVFLFQIDDTHRETAIELKKFFNSSKFINVVKGTTLVGNTLYLELFHKAMRQSFFDIINEHTDNMRSLGILQFQGCSFVNCVELAVNDLNLVPMLERSSHIQFDTFLSLRNLEDNDFKYKGYVELEVILNIPM